MEPEIQGQHILGQAYLRPFGFKQGDKSVICVLKKGETFTTLKGIKSFKKKDNFFDLPTITAIDARSFEKLNGQLETHYPAILEDIQANGCLEPKNEILLKQFVANILCRTSLMRNSIERFYNDLNSREKFLKEISMFVKEPHFNGTKLIETIDAKDRLNFLSLLVMRHINSIFTSFSYCILKDFNNRGWVTSDNPVIIDYNNDNWIIPIEAEIYFPLSKDYCLYLHNPNSNDKRNNLRNCAHGKVSEITEDIQKAIFEKAHMNAEEYIIFPWNFGRVNLAADFLIV